MIRTTRLLALFVAISFGTGSRLPAQTTVGPVGAGKPFSNLQDSLALNYYFPESGVLPGGPAGFNLGDVRITGANFAPGGKFADGHSLSVAENPQLSGLLGNTYGGNATTFNVPNLAGRLAVGVGTAPVTSPTVWTPGKADGTAQVTLTQDNLPPHIHSLPNGGFTAVAGKATPYNNDQPSLAMNYIIRTTGPFPERGVTGNAATFMGTVVPYAGPANQIPADYMLADGRLLDIGQNQALYQVFGLNFGGNGTSNFALPDLRGRTIVGAGERLGTFGSPVGEQFGNDVVSLITSQMAQHTHPLTPTGTTGPAGGGTTVDNRQPSLALTYLVAANANFPTRDGDVSDEVLLGDIVAFAGDYVPAGYLLADGRSLSKAQNLPLFSLYGSTYGSDSTTFKIPDLRARSIIGAGPSARLGTANLAAFASTVATDDLTALLPPITSAVTVDEDGNFVYDLGEAAGASDIPLDIENLAEHANLLPEPSSAALAGLAALGMFRVMRKRRSR